MIQRVTVCLNYVVSAGGALTVKEIFPIPVYNHKK